MNVSYSTGTPERDKAAAQMVNDILGTDECDSAAWELLPPVKGEPRHYSVIGRFKSFGELKAEMSADSFTEQKAAEMLAFYAKDIIKRNLRTRRRG